jgi:hypothetical protein
VKLKRRGGEMTSAEREGETFKKILNAVNSIFLG